MFGDEVLGGVGLLIPGVVQIVLKVGNGWRGLGMRIVSEAMEGSDPSGKLIGFASALVLESFDDGYQHGATPSRQCGSS